MLTGDNREVQKPQGVEREMMVVAEGAWMAVKVLELQADV